MTGIDVAVERLRQHFAADLWNHVTNKIYYAIAYRNLNSDKSGTIGEVWTQAEEYKEVHFDDNYNALCFFDTLDSPITNVNDTLQFQEMNVIFAVNLLSIYPAITSRRPESEVHRDVLVSAKKARGTFEFNEIIPGNNAYGDLFTDNLKSYNMYPWHTFALNMVAQVDYDCDRPDIPPFNDVAGFEYPLPIILTG